MQKLKTYLADSDLTQAEFAKRIGVSQPTVSDWIKGVMKPSVDNLIVVSRATGLSVDELLSDLESTAA